MLSAVTQTKIFSVVWNSRIIYYFAVVLYCFFGISYGETLYVSGNLHDTFLWINSGYFIESGLRPNVDFSTALGPAYVYLNYLAWMILDRTFEIPIITGGMIFIVLAVIVVALRSLFETKFLPDTLFLLFVLLISGRKYDGASLEIQWYGPYNRIGWACLLVFAIMLISHKEGLLRPTQRQKTIVATLAGAFLAYLFLLKISFFLAFGVLYAGWVVSSCNFSDIRVVAVPALMLGCAVAGVHFFVADISFYVGDIVRAASARSGTIELTGSEFLAAVMFVGLNVMIDAWQKPEWSFDWRPCVVWVAMAVAFCIALLGDFGHPLIFFGIILSARIFYRFDMLLRAFRMKMSLSTFVAALLPAFVVMFVVSDSVSVVAAATKMLGSYDPQRYQRVSWVIPGDRKRKADFLIKAEPDQPEFSKIADIIDASPDRERLFEKIAQIDGGVFRHENRTYVAMVDEAVEVLRANGSVNGPAFALEFSNPLPVLLGSPPPEGAPLWIHEGTTFSKTDDALLDTAFSNSSFVLVPHATVDATMRILLNKMFWRYNAINKRFCQYKIGKYWTFYEQCK